MKMAVKISPTSKLLKVMSGIANPIPYKPLKSHVTERILKGNDIDLTKRPAPTFFELDTGPFLTAAVGIFKTER